jgi:FMN phosphatase YigB (HAD superfamily)
MREESKIESSVSEAGGEKPEKKESDKIREEYFSAVEQVIKRNIDARFPKIPEEQRRIKEIKDPEDKTLAYWDKVRNFEFSDFGGETWVIVDFDDVVNRTTTFNRRLSEILAEKIGLSQQDFGRFNNEARVSNEQGKKVFRFHDFIESIKKQFSGKEKIIDDLIQNIDYNQFIDQAVKRSLEAIKVATNTRITILTRGDVKYQKMRIDKTDISQVVDDIVYTEGSKREVAEALMQEFYKRESEKGIQPFVIVVDDNPSEIDDYDKMPLERRFANIQFHHPQAKRYGDKITAKGVVVSEETSPNQAAVNLYQAAEIVSSQYAQEDRAKVFWLLKEPEHYDGILLHRGNNRDTDIHYRKGANNNIIRQFRRYSGDYELEPDWIARHGEPEIESEDWGRVSEDGALEGSPRADSGWKAAEWVDFVEYIRETRS